MLHFGDIFGLSEQFLKQKSDSMTVFSYKASKFEKLVFTNTLTTRFDTPRGSPKSTILEASGELFDDFCCTFCKHDFEELLEVDF